MLLPELKLRRDKIRSLMAQQNIDAAIITCNVNLSKLRARLLVGYLYLPLHPPARLFVKRPNNWLANMYTPSANRNRSSSCEKRIAHAATIM